MEGNGDRKEVSKRFYPSSVHPAIPQAYGSQRRGEVIMQRGSPEPGGGSRGLPVGGARSLPRRLGWSAALAGPGGSGNSRTQAPPPAHFDGKTPNTWVKVAPRPQRGIGRPGQPPHPAAALPRVLGRFHSSAAGGTLPHGQSPAPARDPRSQVPGQAQTPRGRTRLSCPTAACPRPAPLPAAPRPRRCNIWTTKAAVGLNGPD